MAAPEQLLFDIHLLDTFLDAFRLHLIRMADLWWKTHQSEWPKTPENLCYPDGLAAFMRFTLSQWMMAHQKDIIALLESKNIPVSIDVKMEHLQHEILDNIKMLVQDGYISTPDWGRKDTHEH